MTSQQKPRGTATPRASDSPASGSQSAAGIARSAGSAMLFFVIVAALFFAAGHLPLSRNQASTALTPPDALRNTVVTISATFLTIVFALVERRSLLDLGLRARHPIRNLIGGGLSGTAVLSALILLLHHLDLLVFRGQVLYGVSLQWRLALEWLSLSALAAYAAEVLVHGYLQYTLTRAIATVLRRRFSRQRSVLFAFWAAACTGSLAFAWLYRLTWSGGHNGAALSLVNAVLFTLLMAFSLWRTGSLWWAWGFHLAWDWTESFLWGVPLAGVRAPDHLFYTESAGSPLQSGGAAGPTGSIYTLGALLAAFGILMLLHKTDVYPDLREGPEGDPAESLNEATW